LEGLIEVCRSLVAEEFEIINVEEHSSHRVDVVLGMPRRRSLREALETLYPKLTTLNCYPLVRRSERGLVLHVFAREEKPGRLFLNVALALTTLVTVFLSGVALAGAGEQFKVSGFAWRPEAYLVGLLVPLVVHELGHWSVMRFYRTPASLPYLIPAPPLQLGLLGTFGAVINLRWLPPSASSLTLMAVMGPLTGYLIALPLAVYGLKSSYITAVAPEGTIPLPMVPLSLLLLLMTMDVPSGHYIIFSPLAFASYVVFFVTFLNLIPVAMLDGGHIVRGVAGASAHTLVSRIFIVALVLLSIPYPQLLLFAILALVLYLITGGRHPGPSMGVENPTNIITASSIIYGVLLALTIPIPIP
jgi:membrane-associated protease RseP (regulator of RpoE activity)